MQMIVARFVAAGMIVFCASAAFGAELYLLIDISPCDRLFPPCGPTPAWDSYARVESTLLGYPYRVGMRNDHSVYEDDTRLVGWSGWNDGFWSEWESWLEGGIRDGHCYRGRIHSIAGALDRELGSSQVCWSGPIIIDPCRRNPYGPGCSEEEPPECPLIVSLSTGPWELTGESDAVLFDIDADGRLDRMNWTGANSALAFLAYDQDRNGVIDDGRELLGQASRGLDGARVANGFEALKLHDVNLDGLVDARDPIWHELLLWVDADHDGISDKSELRPISTSRIESLETDYERSGRRDQHGNEFRFKGHVVTADGRRPYFDIFFRIHR